MSVDGTWKQNITLGMCGGTGQYLTFLLSSYVSKSISDGGTWLVNLVVGGRDGGRFGWVGSMVGLNLSLIRCVYPLIL